MVDDWLVQQAVERALGDKAAVSQRAPIDFQSNQLFDVWQNGRHYIAKKYLKPAEWEVAPRREFEALQLLAPLDIAPQPIFYDPALGPVVIYQFLEGIMWDRTPPTAVQLEQLAELWLTLNQLPTNGLWLSRGQEHSMENMSAMFHTFLARYEQWAEEYFRPGLAGVATCWPLLEQLPSILQSLNKLPAPPLLFFRSDPRFANIIQRPDGRLGMVDWEDSGLRDPARDAADLLTHPNQEDLLDDEAWDAFLRPYAAAILPKDRHFNERIHFYLAIFPVFWLMGLLNYGVSRAEAGKSLTDWQTNRLPVNIRLRRYLAKAQAWPNRPTAADKAAVAKIDFFPSKKAK